MTDHRMSDVIAEKAFVQLTPDMDKRTVITELARSLATARKIKSTDVDTVIEKAMAREAQGSTGIGHGIAIPHVFSDMVKKIYCAYGMCDEGVNFDSLDGEPVHSVFMLLTPIEKKDEHIKLMRNFALLIRKEHFCEFLRQCRESQGLVDLLKEFEER